MNQALAPCDEHSDAEQSPSPTSRLSQCLRCGWYVDLEAILAIHDPVSEATYEVELSPEMAHAVELLHRTGLFGFTSDEVIANLLRERIRQLAIDGWLEEPDAQDPE